jgi:hypothetical protein
MSLALGHESDKLQVTFLRLRLSVASHTVPSLILAVLMEMSRSVTRSACGVYSITK